MIRKYIILLLLFFSTPLCFAEYIKDITYEQKGDAIIISYTVDLSWEVYEKLNNVSVYVSIDGGEYRRIYALKGDVGSVILEKGAMSKKIEWAVFEEWGRKPVLGSISFKIETDIKERRMYLFHLILGYSYSPLMPVGFFIGGGGARWGGYFNYAASSGYSVDGVNNIDDKSAIYNLRTDKLMRLVVTFGVFYRCNSWLYLYGGLGYGGCYYSYKFDEYSYSKSEIEGYSKKNILKGVEMETGVMLRWGIGGVRLGCTTLNFRKVDMTFGVGILCAF